MFTSHVTAAPRAKRHPVRILTSTPAGPVRIRDSRGIFELTEALGNAEAALVVWKLRGWLMHNESKNKRRNYRDGHWWTYDSLEKWCARDFKWLTPRQLGAIMTKLEAAKVVIRRQYGAKKLKMSYWYSLEEDVIAELITKTKRVHAFDGIVKSFNETVQSSDGSVKSFDETVEYTTAVQQEKNLQKTKQKEPQQQQPLTDANAILKTTPETDVVVVPLSAPPEEAVESKPHGLKQAAGDASAVKAPLQDTPHHNDAGPISKVPLKVLSSCGAESSRLADHLLLAAKLAADLGFETGFAHTLIQRYGAGRVRAVAMYTEAQGKAIHTPPAFIRAELDRNELGLGVCEDDTWESEKTITSDQSLSRVVVDIGDEGHAEDGAEEELPDPVSLDTQVAARMTAREVWRTARQQLSVQDQQFKSWLADARLRDYAYIDGVGTYTVAVTLENARTQMQQRYYRGIESVFKGLQNAPVRIEFEVGT